MIISRRLFTCKLEKDEKSNETNVHWAIFLTIYPCIQCQSYRALMSNSVKFAAEQYYYLFKLQYLIKNYITLLLVN